MNGATLVNDGGILNINNFESNAINLTGTLENRGTINIGQSIGGIGKGINLATNGNLQNMLGGVINLDNTSSMGIDVNLAATFANLGAVKLGQTGATRNINGDGINLDRGAIFTNLSTGLLIIDNINGNGIHQNGRGGVSTNEGRIEIGLRGGGNNIFSAGIRIGDSFENKTGGYIEAKNTRSTVISYRDANLINRICAEIHVHFGRVDGEDGTFLNQGLYESANNTYIEGEIVTFYKTLNCNLGDMLRFNTPTPTLVVSDEWYLDSALTEKAGDYDQATNRFTPTHIQAGQDILFFTVTSPNCTYMVANYIVSAVDIDSTRTWNGSANADWNNRCNWVSGFVPRISEEVIFPQVTTLPTIQNGNFGNAKSVRVETGATLTIAAGGSLTINGSNDRGLLSHGTVNNYGNLDIDDTGTHGIEVSSSGNFTNHSNINLGQSGNTNSISGTGIWNEGTFTHETGNINIDNTGSFGINNQAGRFINRAIFNIGSTGTIGDAGIQNRDEFYNENGLINLDRSNNGGLRNSLGAFYNNGTLNIGQTIGVGSSGIVNWADIENFNQINIDNTENHGIEQLSGFFINNSFLHIGQNGGNGIGGNGIDLIGELINMDTIDIDHVANTAIRVTQQGSLFINIEGVNIGLSGTVGPIGILLEQDGEFQNPSTGSLVIKNLNTGIKTSNTGGSFTNNGDVSFFNHANYAVESLGVFTNTGIIGGEGTFLITSNELGGTLSPGFSPREISFASDIQALANSTLEIEVDGMTNGTFDYISSTANIDISNMTLEVSVGYTPVLNDRIVFLTANSILGTFNNANPALPANWSLDYSVPGEVALQYNGLVFPVELLGFEATKMESDILLAWQTASEINNEGFEIRYSSNGQIWQTIGFVEGEGNSSDLKDYEFIHRNPEVGVNYYQLKQIDYDGQFQYSSIQTVSLESVIPKITVFPNPATDYVEVSFPLFNNPAQLRVFSSEGRSIFQSAITPRQQQINLDIHAWPAGVYSVQIRGAGQTFVQKLIRMD